MSEHFTDRRGEVRSQLIVILLGKYARRVEFGARFENPGTNQDRQVWRAVIIDAERFQKIHARGFEGDKGDKGDKQPTSPCHLCHPKTTKSVNYDDAKSSESGESGESPTLCSENLGAAISPSPLAIRIVGTLQAAGPGGMTPDDLTRTADSGKTGTSLVKATINQLLLAGRIGRTNDRLVFIPQPDQRH
ncbi:MAG: hypothetical protein IPL99_00755 [Candidatus Competibacteraceae bacterium]|nr:hypothetical protein [Candidatus Competibacteraceae bacterium]